MKRSLTRRHFAAGSAALLLSACGGGGGGSIASPTTIGRTESLSVASAQTGFTYPIQVYLPPAYDANATARLPVIYALDGDAAFGYVTSTSGSATRFEAMREVLQRRGTAAVLVGIGGTVRRNTDFLEPGDVAYHAFITQELVPRIESAYRADPAGRILSGLSNGGTFVFLAFMLEAPATPTFAQFWSIETAAPDLTGAGLLAEENALAAAVQGRSVPVTLYLAGATQANGPIVNSLYLQVAAHQYGGLVLKHSSFSTSHVGADIPALNDALDTLVH